MLVASLMNSATSSTCVSLPVVVAHPEGGRDRQAARPNPFEASLLDDLALRPLCLHQNESPL